MLIKHVHVLRCAICSINSKRILALKYNCTVKELKLNIQYTEQMGLHQILRFTLHAPAVSNLMYIFFCIQSNIHVVW